MQITINDPYIPGTVLRRTEMDGVTGNEFLNRIFYITDGIMLRQIREISGVDSSTLQNWVKRGWVANTVNKSYSKEHLARILIINMLRNSMLLERIDYLLGYINGSVDTTEDDIITESALYGYICCAIDAINALDDTPTTADNISDVIAAVTSTYHESAPGAAERLRAALEIIVVAYYASLVAKYADTLYGALPEKK